MQRLWSLKGNHSDETSPSRCSLLPPDTSSEPRTLLTGSSLKTGTAWKVKEGQQRRASPLRSTHASFIEVFDVVQGHAWLLALPCLIAGLFWALMAGRLLAPVKGHQRESYWISSWPPSPTYPQSPCQCIFLPFIPPSIDVLSRKRTTELSLGGNNGLVGDMCSLLYNPCRTMSAKKTTSSCTQCREGDDKHAAKYNAASRVREDQRLLCSFSATSNLLLSTEFMAATSCPPRQGAALSAPYFVHTWINKQKKSWKVEKSDDNTPCTANTSGRALTELLLSQNTVSPVGRQHRQKARE